MSDDLAALLRAFFERLTTAGIEHMVVGSVAALAHGRSRATQDVDVVVTGDEAVLRRLVESLPPERFYADADAAADARRRSTLFNVIDVETGWKLDLIPLKTRPFSRREFARRQRLEVLGVTLPIATVEDTIAAKLEWSKLAGGSERQREDARELVRLAGPRLDRAYLAAAIAELDLGTEWSAIGEEV
jgi:hypothetical protein